MGMRYAENELITKIPQASYAYHKEATAAGLITEKDKEKESGTEEQDSCVLC